MRGARAVCTFAGQKRRGMSRGVYKLLSTTSTPSRRPNGTRHRPTNARPSRVAPTSYPRCLFSHPDTNTPLRGNSQFNPVRYGYGLLLKGPKRTRKTRYTRAQFLPSLPCLPFYHAYESSQVRPPLRSQFVTDCFFFLTWPQGHWR